ncbi:hypothetical protein WL99_28575 [Burkholderia cepacia]|nr:hypothetical protein WK01_17655 [Burkholderia cepacia]KVW05344.1 hypothetical protein WK91_01820 [Burkholderia cepacia]KWA04581.1 hypothetical protein WL26_01460 [Burkholderia cepacia]KWH21782.1 hypothetical protein WL99_28575 [Burkholderia cepacia]
MYANILAALHGMSVFRGREKAPFSQRLEQNLIEPGIGRRLHQFDVERPVRMNEKARDRDSLIRLLAKIVGQRRERLGQQARLRASRRRRM